MLFEDTDDSLYNEGLIVDSAETFAPTPKPQNAHESQAMKQAAMGMVRTQDGFRVGAQQISQAGDIGGEMYSGDSGLSTGTGDWVAISSYDIGNLRTLGVEI